MAKPVHSPCVPEMPMTSTINSPEAVQNSNAEITESERDRIVLRHLPLVRAIAVRVYENLPVHVDLDDLVHAGIMGLFEAALKFNGDKQVSFQGYAKHR